MLSNCSTCEELAKRYEALKRLRALVEAAEHSSDDLTLDPAKHVPLTSPNAPRTAAHRTSP
jgi:hypothetical protein